MANKSKSKKNTLVQEQNKSLFIICGVIIAIIALVGCLTLISINRDNDNKKAKEDDVVDDLGAFRKSSSKK